MAKRALQADMLARMFRVLGDQNRIRILAALSQGERNVTELCKLLRMRQPAVSHHIGILRTSGFVINRRQGKKVFYSICEPPSRRKRSLKAFLNDGAMVRIGPMAFGLCEQ